MCLPSQPRSQPQNWLQLSAGVCVCAGGAGTVLLRQGLPPRPLRHSGAARPAVSHLQHPASVAEAWDAGEMWGQQGAA